MEEVIRSLASGDSDRLGSEKLTSLMNFIPDEEEIKGLLDYSGDLSRLGNAERFCIELSKLPK